MKKGDQSSIVDDERNDGGGTGGVGMFSMTIGEDELIGDAHMASNNPFGMEEDDELPEINEDGFEEIKLKEKANRESVVTVSNVNVAHNIDSENSQDTEDLNDWDLIDEVDVEVDKNGFRPPDYLNDPFKNKWRNIIQAYGEHSKYSNKRTYTLKPIIIKANDDCR